MTFNFFFSSKFISQLITNSSIILLHNTDMAFNQISIASGRQEKIWKFFNGQHVIVITIWNGDWRVSSVYYSILFNLYVMSEWII